MYSICTLNAWVIHMVTARVNLTDYSNRVFNVIKAKFGLSDKSEAINKMADIFGDEFVEKEAKEEYVKKILETEEKHMKKYGYKKMTLKELDKICGVR